MLYSAVSYFLARLFERKYHPCNWKTPTYHSEHLFIQGHGSGILSILLLVLLVAMMWRASINLDRSTYRTALQFFSVVCCIRPRGGTCISLLHPVLLRTRHFQISQFSHSDFISSMRYCYHREKPNSKCM